MIKEIFHAGKWTSAEGITKSYSEKDLDKIIAQFQNGKEKEAGQTKVGRKVPLTVGHPEDNAPAFGWVHKIWRDGKKLMAEFTDMVDVMKSWISQKTYREVSIALNTDWSLRHIGVLGGVPPAVPAMGDWKFKDGEEEITVPGFAFESDNNYETLTLFNQGDNMDLKEAMEKNAALEAENKQLKTDFEAEKGKTTELTAEVETGKKALEDSEKKFSDKDKEFNDLTKEIEVKEEKLADEKDASFVDGLVKDAKLRPVDREITLVNLKAHRGNTEELSFKDSDGKDIKKTALDAYKEALSNAQEIIEPGEHFTGGIDKIDGKDAKLIKLTKEAMKEHSLDYAAAGLRVLAEHPELDGGN